MSNPVVGLTEIVLALAMIAVLALRPGGLFPTHEIGALLTRRSTRQEKLR
jgi:branched-chain amino acid transport system permease protein